MRNGHEYKLAKESLETLVFVRALRVKAEADAKAAPAGSQKRADKEAEAKTLLDDEQILFEDLNQRKKNAKGKPGEFTVTLGRSSGSKPSAGAGARPSNGPKATMTYGDAKHLDKDSGKAAAKTAFDSARASAEQLVELLPEVPIPDW